MPQEKMKFFAREYPHGEVILVFHEKSASPDGNAAVAFAGGQEFYPVDPEVVVKNTKPASDGKAKMLLHQLEKLELPEEFEQQTKRLAPVASKSLRKDDPTAYRSFPRLKHHYR